MGGEAREGDEEVNQAGREGVQIVLQLFLFKEGLQASSYLPLVTGCSKKP